MASTSSVDKSPTRSRSDRPESSHSTASENVSSSGLTASSRSETSSSSRIVLDGMWLQDAPPSGNVFGCLGRV